MKERTTTNPLKKTKLAQKEWENQQHYQEQKNYLELTANLATSPNIQKFFTDLLRKYAEKFADSQDINISHYPLDFGGFYHGENRVSAKQSQDQRPLKNQYQKLGNCCFTPKSKQAVISLNQFYLLFSNSLKESKEKLKECQCEESEKVRVDYLDSEGSGWTYCEKCEARIESAGHHGVIKNRNDPQFWGLNVKEKVLCLKCLGKFQEKMPASKKYTLNKYLKRGYW